MNLELGAIKTSLTRIRSGRKTEDQNQVPTQLSRTWDSTPIHNTRKVVYNYLYAKEHTRTHNRDGVLYRQTEARYRTIINAEQGVIIGWHKFSPKFSGEQLNPPVTILPGLRQWSDVAFLCWKEHCKARKANIRNLNYILSAEVFNYEASAVMANVLDVDKFHSDSHCAVAEEFDLDWPGLTFTMSTREGKALLATSNGHGAAFLLIQHKSTFGEKATIDTVTMYCDDTNAVNLLFHVNRDPPPPPPKEPPKENDPPPNEPPKQT
jgi:hypothetical protein